MSATELRLIDTHCHLHDREIYAEMLCRQKKVDATDFAPEKLMENAARAGVERVITVGTNHADSLAAEKFALKTPSVFWSYGIHPEFATEFKGVELNWKSGLVAIGEVGLDYHYPGYDRAAQIRLLEEMIDLALKMGLPLIFHVREAFEDFFGVLDNFSSTAKRDGAGRAAEDNSSSVLMVENDNSRYGLRGVIHSFSDTKENLEKCLGRDFLIGVNGLATFAEIPLPPLERMLLETDAPYLAPRPYRGKINQPAYVREVAEWLSGRLRVPLTDIATITTQNAEKLFRF